MNSETISYRVSKLTKRFPGVVAVDQVDMNVEESEIHGVIGRNGAGKTVLMKLISGLIRPDEGQIWIGDQEVDTHRYNPGRAHELGVSLIPQEPEFAGNLSVVDNLFMGRQMVRAGQFIRPGPMHEWVEEIVDRLSLNVRPKQRMSELPIETQQLLAFGKAVFVDESPVVLLDEVTASLTVERRDMFLELVNRLVRDRENLSITLISHRVSEIMEVCDRVTVLRDGKAVDTLKVKNTNEKELADLIVGDVDIRDIAEERKQKEDRMDRSGTPLLEARGLSLKDRFEDISFTLHTDEVVGFSGLEGSGWEDVMEVLFGLKKPDEGEILIHGEPQQIHSPRDAIHHGITYLTKDRDERGIIQNCSVAENILISSYDQVETYGRFLNLSRARDLVHRAIEKLKIKTPSLETKIDNLSGGNKQKVLINRLSLADPRIYLLNEPNRGVDIATKPEILTIIRNTLADGSGVIMMSENEQELIEICDRIYIFYKGSIRREVHHGEPDFTVSTVYKGIQGVELD